MMSILKSSTKFQLSRWRILTLETLTYLSQRMGRFIKSEKGISSSFYINHPKPMDQHFSNERLLDNSPKLVHQSRTFKNIFLKDLQKTLKKKTNQNWSKNELTQWVGWLITQMWQTLHQPVLFCGRENGPLVWHGIPLKETLAETNTVVWQNTQFGIPVLTLVLSLQPF